MAHFRTLRLLVAACAVFAAQGHAQTTVASPITWVNHTMTSAVLGADRTYLVSVPRGYASGDARYPVLVITDAEDVAQFTAALANIRFLATRGEAPEMIVVGIPNGADRAHDMTPLTKAANEAAMFPTAGGVDTFVTFFADEILPAVSKSYRTLPAVFFAGHSFGGLLALHAAAARPGVFRGVIAMSPSLQWNNAAYVVEYADLFAKQTAPNRVFVTSGGLEPRIDINVLRFQARMDSVPHAAVALKFARYPLNTHGMTPLPSLVDGIRFLFEPLSTRNAAEVAQAMPRDADSAAIIRMVDDLEREYAASARSMGMPEAFPEVAMNQQGYIALQWFQNPRAAVALFERNVARYPKSANVYDSLGDGLIAAGDMARAREVLAKSIALSKVSGEQMILNESTRKLNELNQAN